MSFASPKGTYDIIPSPKEEWRSSHLWQWVEGIFSNLCKVYGFEEIRTPLFERTELFQRSVGEASDIVSKEMYTFQDKAGRSMSLRPEMTASVVRSFIENKMQAQGTLHKLFYSGPMFRYDRPQAGRYRQFFQVGAEIIGGNLPEHDVELIDLLYTLYDRIGLKNLKLHINSVGTTSCRKAFAEALRDFLTPQKEQLSSDSQRRLELNPLRILDSKDASDQALLQGGPSLSEFLNDVSKKHFDDVLYLLERVGIPFQVNPKLVRGLDYYTKTVFEITAGELGAQDTIGAGGRYDGLIKSLGGPDLPGVGFSTGIERILQTALGQKCALPKRPVAVLCILPLGEKARTRSLELAKTLRSKNIICTVDYTDKKLKDALSEAAQIGAHFVLIVGENELRQQCGQLKDMKARTEKCISLDSLAEELLNV